MLFAVTGIDAESFVTGIVVSELAVGDLETSTMSWGMSSCILGQ